MTRIDIRMHLYEWYASFSSTPSHAYVMTLYLAHLSHDTHRHNSLYNSYAWLFFMCIRYALLCVSWLKCAKSIAWVDKFTRKKHEWVDKFTRKKTWMSGQIHRRKKHEWVDKFTRKKTWMSGQIHKGKNMNEWTNSQGKKHEWVGEFTRKKAWNRCFLEKLLGLDNVTKWY